MRAEVGGNGKVPVQRWRADALLDRRQVRCFPSYKREERLAESVPPRRELSLVWCCQLCVSWTWKGRSESRALTVVESPQAGDGNVLGPAPAVWREFCVLDRHAFSDINACAAGPRRSLGTEREVDAFIDAD